MAACPTEANVAVVAGPLAAAILKSWMCWTVNRCHFAQYDDPGDLAHSDHKNDLILLGDLFTLPQETGDSLLNTVSRLVGPAAGTPVAVVSDGDKFELGLRCLQAGVRGFIPTNSSLAVAISALRLILNGGVYVPVEILAETDNGRSQAVPTVVRPPGPDRAQASALDTGQLRQLGLSRREMEIFGLLQQGAGNRQIATTLGISDNTVMVHMRNLMRKLGATNRAQAVFKARQKLATLLAPAET